MTTVTGVPMRTPPHTPVILPYESGAFNTIYADPPWPEYGGGVKGGRRGANRHYDLMSVTEIRAMGVEVQRVAGKNAHLYLWVTNNYLEEGLQVMRDWGFKYKTTITWVKDRFGLGQYYRGQTEQCLFGVRGVLPYRTFPDGKRAQGVTVIHAPRREHSEKPSLMREMIEAVSHGPYLELFARTQALPNWTTWGAQASTRPTQLTLEVTP
jgi:N6-adenosine-specific RNA methylase IME4